MSSATRLDHLTLRPRSLSPSPRRAAGVFIADFKTPPPGFEPATSGSPRLEFTAASTTGTVPPRGTSGTFTGAAVAGTPAAARAAATAAASDRTSPPPPPPPPPTDTNASPAPTGTIRGGSTAAASAPYAAADAALAPASEPFARCSAAAVKTTRTASNVPGSIPASGKLRAKLSASRGVRGSGSAGASSSASTSSWVGRTSSSASSSVSSPSVSVSGSVGGGFSFSFSFAARGRTLVILRTPGSSVPSSANSAHGRSRPAASDSVTHAGVTTGGWSRSDRASASSFAFVNRRHTTCVTVLLE